MSKITLSEKCTIISKKASRYLIILLIPLLFSACVSLGENTTIDFPLNNQADNIRLNGYYYYADCDDFSVWNDSTKRYEKNHKQYKVTPLIFYRNGLVYTKRRGIWEDSVCTNNDDYQESLPHTNLMNIFIKQNNTSLKTKKDCIGWGMYNIHGDSVYIEYYNRAWQHIGTRSNKLLLTELYGQILNDSTILISGKIYPPNHEFHFVSSTSKPDSLYFTSIMKKQKLKLVPIE